MGLFKFKTALAGLTTILAASFLFADAVVDADFDDNQNDFEYYWYYYDDNAGVGPNDRPQLFPELTPTIVNVDYTEKDRGGYDGTDASDTWQVKQYTFTTTEHLAKKCGTMPFTFGDPWEADYCATGKACAMPFVGIGTMLTKEKGSIDLTGVESIHFYAKSRVNELNEVTVKIETLDINEYAFKPGDQMEGDEFGYYGYVISVAPGDWQEFTIDVASLDLPGSWAHDFDFDITQCTKLAWEIKGDGEITVDTFDIAEVSFLGDYVFVSPSMWIAEEATYPDPTYVFSTFETAPYNQSGLGTYWYAYNDAEVNGTSWVAEEFAYKDTITNRLYIEFMEGYGSDGVGRSAALEYELGPPIPKDTISILGFVGIGCNLYDSVKVEYWDAAAAGATSVFFEYYTDAGAKFVTLELSDINDVGDADNPERKDTRGSGIVYYRNFPATNGVWRKVMIPFDSLVTHDTWEGYTHIDLDKANLAKIQWKVTGAEGTSGLYAIDNIYFPNATFGVGVDAPEAVKAVPAGFRAVYNNGRVRVNWDGAAKLANGRVNLINTRGAVVATSAMGKSGRVNLATERLAAGLYFASLSGVDADGKAVTSRAAINIIR
jgi:hypothetical protein